MKQLNRIDFLDFLRAFIIVLVIVMHTAIAYFGMPNWVHVSQPGNVLLGVIVLFAESGVWMPILFFIAGFFTLSSLQKRRTGEFIKGKLVRIGLPFGFGLIILSPILWLLSYYSDGGSLPMGQAIASFFTLKNFNQFHFWFLGVLLLFFLMIAAAYKWFPTLLTADRATMGSPSAMFLIGFIVITSVLCFCVNLIASYSAWSSIGILTFQPVKAPLYAAYFLLGIYAFQNGWFQEGFHPRLFPWALIYLGSFIFYLDLAGRINGNAATVIGKFVVNSTASVEVLSALMTSTALFQKFFGGDRPVLRRVSSVSFEAYIIHLNILFLVLLFTRGLALPLFPMYGMQALLTVLISWSIAMLIHHRSSMVDRHVSPSRQSVLD